MWLMLATLSSVMASSRAQSVWLSTDREVSSGCSSSTRPFVVVIALVMGALRIGSLLPLVGAPGGDDPEVLAPFR
jgi:hypothetical protein